MNKKRIVPKAALGKPSVPLADLVQEPTGSNAPKRVTQANRKSRLNPKAFD